MNENDREHQTSTNSVGHPSLMRRGDSESHWEKYVYVAEKESNNFYFKTGNNLVLHCTPSSLYQSSFLGQFPIADIQYYCIYLHYTYLVKKKLYCLYFIGLSKHRFSNSGLWHTVMIVLLFSHGKLKIVWDLNRHCEIADN